MFDFIKNVVKNMPQGWLSITTHRLDIYKENLAKTEFLEQFENLYNNKDVSAKSLANLPTAYDYIRLGHPLSCVLEWVIAKQNNISANQVISFSSKTIPVMAILRKNALENKNTLITYTNSLPDTFDFESLKSIYNYHFELKKVVSENEIPYFDGTTIFISQEKKITPKKRPAKIDYYVQNYAQLGSILILQGKDVNTSVKEIQHVRRRETIAMTPANCLVALHSLIAELSIVNPETNKANDRQKVVETINKITETNTKVLVASSGLSIQYAILMGLIDSAVENYSNKEIKIIVPPNCYGGTNDQARRVAACLENVEVVDLPVDGGNDMVKSIDTVLAKIALADAVPFIIAEIPTNPRVEVPNLHNLKEVLSKKRKTSNGNIAIAPVFILDQTFCPNVQFLGENEILATIKTISFASGSKFPSGGLCTAGYCVGNSLTTNLIDKIEKHLILCDNEATALQYEILANQMPRMNQRIANAYTNTREFVTFIQEILPTAKINFVSEELANNGFTPSVFSLDLPTKGKTEKEKETHKRALNLKLINLMINKIPNQSKFCVSYGQLKGSYWTIPATSTQGTTKEGDKDYIVRVSISPNLDLDLHKKVFLEFVKSM